MNNSSSNYANPALRLLGSAVLLMSGLIVYWLYRPDIVLFQWLHMTNPAPLIADTHFEWLLNYYFADVVWCLALVLVISLLRDWHFPRGYRQALVALPFGSEILQASGIIPGVFDWVDMTLYLLIMIPTLTKEFKPMKKMEKNIVGSLVIAFFTFALVASGRPDPVYVMGTFTFPDDREDELFTKTDLVKSLDISGTPSIVLRVANPREKVTKEQGKRYSALYNLIEKEFSMAGFAVRDRQLFTKVLEQETNDYSKIGAVTETDFIVELLRYELRSKRKTNKYIDEDGDEAEAPFQVSFNGAVIEFKLVSLEKNDMVGAYTFYWTPCTEGCTERFNIKASRWNVNNSIPTEFFKESARQIARELGYLK